MQKLTSLKSLAGRAGLAGMGLVILVGLAVNVGRAQDSFAAAQVLPSDSWGSIANDNSAVTPDSGVTIAGLTANAPLWYSWTAPQDGEVELDTMGSVDEITLQPLDTVLAVYTGNSLATLNQVAANDDLYPYYQLNETGQNIYDTDTNVGPFAYSLPIAYYQPYSGPSGLRFNAKAGVTYYFAVDSNPNKFGIFSGIGKGLITLNWAYHSSGAFRFATENVDQTGIVNPDGTPMLLYPTAETETSRRTEGTIDAARYDTTYNNYETYNVPGVLVTVTRTAGSSGRVAVDFTTVNGDTNLINNGDYPAKSGKDYVQVTNTLVFDDFEMSKTVLIPILDDGGASQPNRDFTVVLSNPRLVDPSESSSVSPPRVDADFGEAMVRILDCDIDPKGESSFEETVTNGFDTNNAPILGTNTVYSLVPTNAVFNFMKANFQVSRDATNWWKGTPITVYVCRTGTNDSSQTVYWSVDSPFLDKGDVLRDNEFPLQPGSDYATPDPAKSGGVLGLIPDFNFSGGYSGSLTFPGNGNNDPQPIEFTVYDNGQTAFNEDFRISLWQLDTHGHPIQAGMVAQTTVTILTDTSDDATQYDDEHPPAGSVDENYNPDFGLDMAPPINTAPQQNAHPGTDGEVYSLAILTNNESLIAGDFFSYNGAARNSIALIQTNGALDTSFDPGSGANDFINSVAISGRKFYIGGGFSSYNGTERDGIARVNANGSLDTSFSPGLGADGTVWAVVAQPDGKVIIGGDFTHINSTPRNYLARLNADGSLDDSFDPSNILDGPVYAIALPRSVGVNISRSSNTNAEDDQITTMPANVTGTVTITFQSVSNANDLQIYYGTGLLFDSGPLSSVTNTYAIPYGPGNTQITIVVNRGSAAAGDTAWSYTATVSESSGYSGLVIGGDFDVSGQTYKDVARLNSDGSLDASFNPGTGADNPVYALGWQLDGKTVIGGAFTHINGSSLNHVARLNADGTIDAAGFFSESGANDTVDSISLALDGTIYIGGLFTSYNDTHRLSFARLYSDGTLDTTFMDTAYNQFAGLPRIYSYDTPGVFASGIQSDGNVMIGGNFSEVGGGQYDPNVRQNASEGYDLNVWTERKVRDGVRNRSNVARLVGGATPGPGNISLSANSYSASKSQQFLYVGLVRTNGSLGPLSANFSVLPGTAQSGLNNDYFYSAVAPLYWIGWEYVGPSRMHSDGLFGLSGYENDIYGDAWSGGVASFSQVYVNVLNNANVSGDLNANFQLSTPSTADQFYLGGENVPLGGALGQSAAPFTIIDDNRQAGTLGFSSSTFIATNTTAAISLVRSNGSYGKVSMNYSTADGTAKAGTDYTGIANHSLTFLDKVPTNGFNVQILNNSFIYTSVNEKEFNLKLSNLSAPQGASVAFGISNALVRIINPNYQGYLTFSAANYSGTVNSGLLTFFVNRISGSKGSVSIQYATTNGTALNGVDYTGTTNTLNWNNGDVSPKTVTIKLLPNEQVGSNKQFAAYLFNPELNGVSAPTLLASGVISNATLTIINDNSYGALQFGAPVYTVNENGGYATIPVIRTGGAAGTISAVFATSDGPNTKAGINYSNVNGTITFEPGELSTNIIIPILDDGIADPAPADFYFNVSLTGPSTAASAVVQIVDAESYYQPPGSADPSFNSDGMDGDVLALALQPNGQILAAGNFTHVGNVNKNHVARLNADGSLDAGFLNGYSGANGSVRTLVHQTDGRILIGGAFTLVDGVHYNYLARLMADGSLDTSFNPGAGADSPVYAMAETFIGGERKIYVGGAFGNINSVSSPGIARLDNFGNVDSSFASGLGVDGSVYAIAVYPTNSIYAGKVLIGGAFTHYNGTNLNYIARLNADGSIDATFNPGSGADSSIQAISIQSDGRILIGGAFTNFNGVAANRVARLNADGSVDTNFVASLGGGANGTVEGITLQPDNRILLVGQFTEAGSVTRNYITRLLPTGAVDPTINFGDGANGDIAAAVQPADGNIV
ncbi:MAG: Calx-beta domain-containing protein, partial [Limisphaerales bacterium]